MLGELEWVPWSCAICGTTNESPIDPTLAARQQFTEDCACCCRPNLVTVLVRADGGEVQVTAEFDE